MSVRTNWAENVAITPDRLNNIENRIDEANTNLSNAKPPISQAITSMGQPSTEADSFATMANKIKAISTDANAVEADALAGKSFYSGGAKKVGNIPVRANDVSTSTVWTDGNGNLAIGFLTGAYLVNSGFGAGIASALVNDPDFVASNILYGKNVLGLPGTLVPFVAGGGIVNSNDATVYTPAGTTYVKMKETKVVGISGRVRVFYNIGKGTTSYPYYGQLYKNGVAIGPERSGYTPSSQYTWNFVTFSEDIDVVDGDLIQIYAQSGNSYFTGVQNFRIGIALPAGALQNTL